MAGTSASSAATSQALDRGKGPLPVPGARIGDLERLVILGLATEEYAVAPTAAALPIDRPSFPTTRFLTISPTFRLTSTSTIALALTATLARPHSASIHD